MFLVVVGPACKKLTKKIEHTHKKISNFSFISHRGEVTSQTLPLKQKDKQVGRKNHDLLEQKLTSTGTGISLGKF